MNIEDYKKVLWLSKAVDDANRIFREAAKPWEETALEIARELNGELVGNTVVLEENKVRYLCHGTGIYRDDDWWESFPLEKLLERMRKG